MGKNEERNGRQEGVGLGGFLENISQSYEKEKKSWLRLAHEAGDVQRLGHILELILTM